MAKGDGIFLACEWSVFSPLEGFEIYGDPERSPDLVLAAVATTDGASLIIKYREVLAESCGDGAGFFDKFRLIFEEGKDARFNRGHARVKVKDNTGFLSTFIVGDFFFVVGLAEESECSAIDPCARFDDVRQKFLAGFFVEIFQGFAAGFLMLF